MPCAELNISWPNFTRNLFYWKYAASWHAYTLSPRTLLPELSRQTWNTFVNESSMCMRASLSTRLFTLPGPKTYTWKQAEVNLKTSHTQKAHYLPNHVILNRDTSKSDWRSDLLWTTRSVLIWLLLLCVFPRLWAVNAGILVVLYRVSLRELRSP